MIPFDLTPSLPHSSPCRAPSCATAWSREVRTTPPNVSAGLLRLALAHHLQSKVIGGITKAMERKLQEIADAAPQYG